MAETSPPEVLPAAVYELAARVPAWRGLPLKISTLSGGHTNHNYKVETDGQAYVLRIGGANTDLLGIDRRTEYAAAVAAASIGASPPVLHLIEPEGYLVTHFIAGHPVSPEQMRHPATITQAAALLRRVHALPPIPGTISPFAVIREYRALTAARGEARYPLDLSELYDRANQIEEAFTQSPLPACPCHNDLLNENFLLDDATGELRLLDWEYAGMGDPYFDLANLAAQHDFGPEQDQALLEAYFGDATPSRAARLRLMKIMSDFREAMWGILQSVISKLDFDFPAYSSRYFQRVSSGMSDPRLNEWLATAVSGQQSNINAR